MVRRCRPAARSQTVARLSERSLSQRSRYGQLSAAFTARSPSASSLTLGPGVRQDFLHRLALLGTFEVWGSSSSHYGVRGLNTGSAGNNGAGVHGAMSGSAQSPGVGVHGKHTGTGSGDGVRGESDSGYGVRGEGPKGDFIASGSGKLYISQAGSPGSTATGSVGTIARDAAGALWYCYATNKWRELAGSTSSGAFHAISPKRVYDSRVGQEPLGVTKGKLGPGSTRVVDCSVAAEVPPTATAVVLNLTAANTTGLGNLAVYPDGSPAPATSSINFTGGVNIANSTTSGCGPGAKLKVLAGGSTGADFIIDIVGYYV